MTHHFTQNHGSTKHRDSCCHAAGSMRQTSRAARNMALALAAIVALGSYAIAAPIVPAGLNPGGTYHLVFATKDMRPGDFGSIAVGDSIVNTAANQAGAKTMGAAYRAILSDSTTNAISLGSSFLSGGSSPVYNTQGELVATSFANMFLGSATSLTNPIRYDEFGATTNFGSWTGTNSLGVHSGASFVDWTGGPGPGTRGGTQLTTSQWVDSGANSGFGQPLRLYGISEQLTAPVPEPSTVCTGLMALCGVSAVVMRRRLG